MPKMFMVAMENEYPFSHQIHLPPNSDSTIVVKQTIKINNNHHNSTMAKATFIKNLRNRHLVRVQSIMEEEDSIHILYEHIPEILNWKTQSIQSQLRQFTTYLSNIGVCIQFQENRFGITENGYFKYFMGIDFNWDNRPDQNILIQHYQAQIHKLLTNKQQIIPFKSKNEEKVSLGTLPSHYNRLMKIGQQLNHIKSNSNNKDFSYIFNNLMMRSHSNDDISIKYPSLSKMRKFEEKKYTKDHKISIYAKNKYQTKETDVKSQLGRNNSLIEYERNHEEVEILNKTRFQEMKYKEYKEITRSNKNYLKDFLSVLEDENDEGPEINSIQPKQPEKKSKFIEKDTAALQNKARQAINNSIKAIKKFRSLGA